MEFFEVKKDEVEERAKQKFMESYQKQLKMSRILLTSIFGGLGIFFLISGISCLLSEQDLETAIIFLSIGGTFLGFAVVCFIILLFVKPDKAYERMKRLQNKYGVMNLYTLSSTSAVQEERVNELEARIEELEAEVEHLRRNINK